MATNVFDLFAKLGIDTSDYYKGLNGAENAAKKSTIGQGLASAAKIGVQALMAASTAIVGFGAASVKVGETFDKSMSQVGATMGAKANEMVEYNGKTISSIEALRDYAQEMGRTTAFSATQAADALNYMALAGYDAETSMNMLPNVLNLAAAGSMDLALASDMVTDTQTAFGISLERTSQMVDEMAKASSTGNTSVQQLGEAFLTVGGLAQELNGGMVTLADGTEAPVDNIQELEIALTAMANAGIKGSEAGTHMRNMLLKLSSPTADGAKQLEALGVKVFDTEGNMRSLKNIMGDLSGALGDLTQEQKIQAISDLFNTRDLAAAESLLNAVGEDWDEIGAAILDAKDAAQTMADTQLDNLAGDVTLFKSALEGAQIAISDELTPSLRKFVQFGTDGLSTLTSAFKEGGLSGAMDAFGTILSDGLAMIVSSIPKVLEAGGQLLSAFVQGVLDNTGVILDAGVKVIDTFQNAMLNATNGEGNIGLDIISSILEKFNENGGRWIDAGFQIISNIISGIADSLPRLLDSVGNTVSLLIQKFTDPQNLGNLIQGGVELVTSLASGIIKGLPKLLAQVPVVVRNLLTVIKQNVPVIIGGVVELVNMLVAELPNIITELLNALPEILVMVVDTIVELLPVFIDGIEQLFQGIADNLPQILQAIIDALPVIIQTVIDALITLVPALVQGAIQLTIAVLEHLPEIIAAIIQAIPQIIEAIIMGFLPLSDRVVGLFSDIGNAISSWWGEKKKAISDGWNSFITNFTQWLQQLPYNLGYALADMLMKFKEWASNVLKWVTTEIPKIITNIVNFFKELPSKIWEWLKGVVTKVGEWGSSMIETITTEVPKIIDKIVSFFTELPAKALQWGKDMIQGFIDGIGAMAQAAWDSVTGFAQGIADRLGFSEPEIGPLSNFHTYAPDMMELFAEGVRDNTRIVTDAIEDAFDFSESVNAPETDYQSTYHSDTTGALSQVISLLQELVDDGFNVTLEGDTREIFNVVERQNRQRTKATGYNALSMTGG